MSLSSEMFRCAVSTDSFWRSTDSFCCSSSAVRVVTCCSSRVFNCSSARMRTRNRPYATPVARLSASRRNHQVFQNGGVIVIASVAPTWFQTPSLLLALTRNTYEPGSRLV